LGCRFNKTDGKRFKKRITRSEWIFSSEPAGYEAIFLFYRNTEIVQQVAVKLENEKETPGNEILQQAAVKLTSNSLLTKIPWWHHQVTLSK